MKYDLFDRSLIRFKSLTERSDKVLIERDFIFPDAPPDRLNPPTLSAVLDAAGRIRRAREKDRAVILAFGAHAIKNGLSPVLIRLIAEGWVTHLATNGAGIIHDWEFAFQGSSSEDVRANLPKGEFGIWRETGLYLNLALTLGAFTGMGYGESVGALVEEEGLRIPLKADLLDLSRRVGESDPATAAAALDLFHTLNRLRIEPGFLKLPHPFKQYGLQAAAFRLGVPFTGHPMFGHDIIYTHPANCGAAIGRTAERDFLSFAQSVANLEEGVYISVGSAVMSPMIFEKALSMARNVAAQKGRSITNHSIFVVDLAESTWDWDRDGEPPADNAAYYLRYCKTFSRCGGSMTYVQADNREFLPALCRKLLG